MKKYISTIDHEIRYKLKLNCLEYCIANLIDENPKISTGAIIDILHIPSSQIDNLLQELNKKNIIDINLEESDQYILLEKWTNEFKIDDSVFEELWAIHNSGNKATCKKRIPAVLKKISKEELIKKLKAYLQACDLADRSKKDLSTWLNPEKEHWNDPLPTGSFKRNFGTPAEKKDTKTYIIK